MKRLFVEIKAASALTSLDVAQLLNYLKATGMSLGLLINFGAANKLEWRRFAFTQRTRPNSDASARFDILNVQPNHNKLENIPND